MKLAATIATAALAASHLASTVRAEDIYITLLPPSDLQIRAQDSLLHLKPDYALSESDLRPDMRPIIGLDTTFKEQEYFSQLISGRSWSDGPYSSSQFNQKPIENKMIFYIAPLENNYHNDKEESRNPLSMPSPSTLTLIGLGALAAAKRVRK